MLHFHLQINKLQVQEANRWPHVSTSANVLDWYIKGQRSKTWYERRVEMGYELSVGVQKKYRTSSYRHTRWHMSGSASRIGWWCCIILHLSPIAVAQWKTSCHLIETSCRTRFKSRPHQTSGVKFGSGCSFATSLAFRSENHGSFHVIVKSEAPCHGRF
jgi:hypothetical protein